MPAVPRPHLLGPITLGQLRNHRLYAPSLLHQPPRPGLLLALLGLVGRKQEAQPPFLKVLGKPGAPVVPVAQNQPLFGASSSISWARCRSWASAGARSTPTMTPGHKPRADEREARRRTAFSSRRSRRRSPPPRRGSGRLERTYKPVAGRSRSRTLRGRKRSGRGALARVSSSAPKGWPSGG